MMIVNDYVPHYWRGIIVAGFLAAFMSTIATQLNWGTSYIVEDFYRRFLVRHASERHYVHVSQLVTILLVIVTGYVSAQLASIRSGWEVVLQVGAGTGSVYMLRWYWWRINAWSEISAMITALVATLALHWKGLAGRAPRPPVAFRRLRHGRLRQRHPHHHAADHGRLDRRNSTHRKRTGQHPPFVLQKSSPRRDRLATHRRASPGNSPNARSSPQSLVLDSRLRNGLQRPIRRRQTPTPQLAAGNFSGRC